MSPFHSFFAFSLLFIFASLGLSPLNIFSELSVLLKDCNEGTKDMTYVGMSVRGNFMDTGMKKEQH